MDNHPKILIVDDDAHFGRTLSDILTLKGYKPFVAQQGKTALDIVRTNSLSVVLIDLILPDTDGLRVMREIKKYCPHTECIVLTGHASQTSAIEAVNMGAYSYVQKPYNIEQLLLVIRRAVEKQQSEDALLDSEARYRCLFNSGNDAVMVFHILPECRLGKFIEVNDIACQKLGYPREELLNLSFDDIEIPENQRERGVPTGKLFSEKHILFETSFIPKNRTSFPVEINSRLFDLNGCPTVLACARDVTERKRTEKINHALSELGYKLNTVTSPKEAADVILSAAQELFGWDASLVFIFSEDDGRYYPIIAFDTFGNEKKESLFPYDYNLCDKYIVRTLSEGPQLILREPDFREDDYGLTLFGNLNRRSLSLMFIPIRKGKRNVGTLSIQSYAPYKYDSSDLNLLQMLADQCSGALDRTFTEEKLRQKDNFTIKLSDLGQNLSSITKPKDAAMLILNTADYLFGWDSAFISYYSHEDDKVYDLATLDTIDGQKREIPGDYEVKGVKYRVEKTLKLDSRLILRDSIASPDPDDLLLFGDINRRSASLMFTPIRKGESIVGIISIQSYRKRAFTQDDLKSLEIFADYCGGALDRIFTEARLHESEEKLRLLTEQIPSILWTTDTDLRFTLLLGAGLKALHLNPDQIIGKTLSEFFHVDDSSLIPVVNHIKAMDGVSSTFEMEFMGMYFHSYVEPLRNAEGNIIGCISVSNDITERKKAEEELKLAHEIYPKAIENAKGVPYYLNLLDGTYEFIGQGWDELIGIPSDNMKHCRIKDVVDEVVVRTPGAPADPVEYGKHFREGKIDRYRTDIRIHTPKGEVKWLTDCAVPIRDEKTNKVIASLGIIQDITERKQIEKLYESFAALGQKLSTVTNARQAGKVILDTADELLGLDAAFIDLYIEEKDELYTVLYVDRIDGRSQEVPCPEFGRFPTRMIKLTLDHGAQLIENRFTDIKQEYTMLTFGDHKRKTASFMFCPIRKGKKNIGVISIQSYTPGKYNAESLRMFQFLADHSGGALERILAEEKLFRSEEQLRLLTQQIPALLWSTDENLNFTIMLGSGLSALNLKPNQLVGRSLFDFFKCQDPSVLPIALHKQALEGKSATYEMEIDNKFFHSYVEPLGDAEGNIIGCIGVAHDITDRLHSEEALRKAHAQLEQRVKERTRELSQSNTLLKREIKQRKKVEENLENSLSLLRATLESTTDGILVVNNDGVIVNYNQRFVRMWNLTRAAMKKRDYQTIEKCCLGLVLDPGAFQTKVREMSSNPETSSFDIVELKDNRILERYSMPQRIGEKAVGRVWSFRDVTNSKRAEESLARSEAIYREAIEKAAGVPYRFIYKDNYYDFVGEGINSLFGISPEEFNVKELRKFIKEVVIIDPDAPPRLLDYVDAFQRGEVDQYRVDLRIQTRAGEEKWVSDCSVPIRDSQTRKVIGSLGILQDVTKRKRMEEQARRQQEQLVQTEKMAALGILVSGVAHEINNPNNFIMLNVPTLHDSWASVVPVLDRYYEQNGDFLVGGVYYSTMRKHVPELFNCILAGANRIKNIVQELRDFARESDATQMELVDMNAVVKSSLTLLENMIKKSTDHFSVDYCDKIPKTRGNFQRLEQVVINLIQNACQSLPDKDKTIYVSTRCDLKKKRVVLEIGDQGSGIPSEIQKHIMDPFFTTKREKGGVGLGLSISSKIINEHKGIMEFKSKPGAGTIATIELPMEN
jgi:PAS domain S-box-containing protein